MGAQSAPPRHFRRVAYKDWVGRPTTPAPPSFVSDTWYLSRKLEINTFFARDLTSMNGEIVTVTEAVSFCGKTYFSFFSTSSSTTMTVQAYTAEDLHCIDVVVVKKIEVGCDAWRMHEQETRDMDILSLSTDQSWSRQCDHLDDHGCLIHRLAIFGMLLTKTGWGDQPVVGCIHVHDVLDIVSWNFE